MPPFNITVPAGLKRTLPEPWRHFFCESATAEIVGIAEQSRFPVKRGIRVRGEQKEKLELLNETAGDVTVTGYYGLEEAGNLSLSGESVAVTSLPNVTIDALPAVEVEANNGVSVAADASVGTTDKQDFAAPANAKAAVVSLVTSGFTFGEVRVSGSNVYAADTGIPLPVDGSPIYIDAAVDLTVHNKHASNAASVNVTWISKS